MLGAQTFDSDPGLRAALRDAGDHGFHDRCGIESMRTRLKIRTEPQLHVIQPVTRGVFDVFARDTPAGVDIRDDGGHPMQTLEPRDEVRHDPAHLDVRSQRLDGVTWQRDAVLAPQIEDRRQAHVAIEVTV